MQMQLLKAARLAAERRGRVSRAAGEGQQSGGGGSAERQGRVSAARPRAQEYVAVMEPLVLEECGALLLRGHEDAEVMRSSPGVSVAPVQIVRQRAASRLGLIWGRWCSACRADTV